MDLEADMYLYVMDKLPQKGGKALNNMKYQILQKNDMFSRHNNLYWTLEPYLAMVQVLMVLMVKSGIKIIEI